jgi:hypothetical protein
MIFSAHLPVSCARILGYEENEPRSRCPQIKSLKLVKSKVRSGVASSVLLASSQLGLLYVTGPETGFSINAIHCFHLMLFVKRSSDENGRSFQFPCAFSPPLYSHCARVHREIFYFACARFR